MDITFVSTKQRKYFGAREFSMIFAFVSLKMVAYYGNYSLIITKINQLIATVLNSVDAGIGNLVAEGDKEKIEKVFWELMAIRYFFSGVVVFSLYQLIDPFITLWLGSNYVLSHTVLTLLLITVFIMCGMNKLLVCTFYEKQI